MMINNEIRNKIVTDMCYTIRHDYGLDAHPDCVGSGVTDAERQALYRQMSQLYDHHIQPLVDKIEELQNGKSSS